MLVHVAVKHPTGLPVVAVAGRFVYLCDGSHIECVSAFQQRQRPVPAAAAGPAGPAAADAADTAMLELLNITLGAHNTVNMTGTCPRELLSTRSVLAWWSPPEMLPTMYHIAHATARNVACVTIAAQSVPSANTAVGVRSPTALGRHFPHQPVRTMTVPGAVHAMAFAPDGHALAIADAESVYVVAAPALDRSLYCVPLPRTLGAPTVIAWPGPNNAIGGQSLLVVWPKDVGIVDNAAADAAAAAAAAAADNSALAVATSATPPPLLPPPPRVVVPTPIDMQRVLHMNTFDAPDVLKHRARLRRRNYAGAERLMYELRNTVVAAGWPKADVCDLMTLSGDLWRLRLAPPMPRASTQWALGTPAHTVFSALSARFAITAHTMFAVALASGSSISADVPADPLLPMNAVDAAIRLLAAATFTFTAQ